MLLPCHLTCRVDIESPTVTNTDGVSVEAWGALARGIPADVVARESMTARQAAGIQPQTSHLVRMRIRTDVTSKCRLVLDGRYLNILGPPRRVPEARPVELVMECVEVET